MTKISLHEVRKFPAMIFCYEFPASGTAGYFPALLIVLIDQHSLKLEAVDVLAW
jgi:hypothetical protein